jgi:hypothetical protein
MLSGTGLKNKVLEACAQTCPVVATSLAVAGIPAGPENGILVADDPNTFAARLVQLLIEPDQAERLGQAGAAMVRDQMSWPRAAAALRAALEQSLSNRAPVRHAQCHPTPAARHLPHPALDTASAIRDHREEGTVHAAS